MPGSSARILLVWGLWVSGVIFTGPVPHAGDADQRANVDADDWAMAGRDAAHTAAVTAPMAASKVRSSGGSRSQPPLPAAPAVSDGQLFLGTGDNRLVAVDSASGDVLWDRRLSSVTVTTPAVTPGAVYVMVRDGRAARDGPLGYRRGALGFPG